MPGREVTLSLRTRHFREAEHRAALVGDAFPEAWRLARRAMADGGGTADVGAVLRACLSDALAVDLDLSKSLPG